jgi:hypothetical protein
VLVPHPLDDVLKHHAELLDRQLRHRLGATLRVLRLQDTRALAAYPVADGEGGSASHAAPVPGPRANAAAGLDRLLVAAPAELVAPDVHFFSLARGAAILFDRRASRRRCAAISETLVMLVCTWTRGPRPRLRPRTPTSNSDLVLRSRAPKSSSEVELRSRAPISSSELESRGDTFDAAFARLSAMLFPADPELGDNFYLLTRRPVYLAFVT